MKLLHTPFIGLGTSPPAIIIMVRRAAMVAVVVGGEVERRAAADRQQAFETARSIMLLEGICAVLCE